MSKIELNTSIADYGFSQINNNFQLIEDELNQKVLYRDNPVGEPNALDNDLDANGKNVFGVNDLHVDNEIFLNGNTIQEAIDLAAGGLVADATAAAADSEASAILSQASATSSAASASASAASFDSFDDRYLGAKASPPTVDNDGNPLLIGALYWDTTLSPGGTFPADSITVTPVGNIGSTTVQAALQELDTEKAKLNGDAAVAFSSSAFTGPLTGNVTGATTGAHNGTVGATTPNTVAATTITATGTITPSQTAGIVGTTTNNNANAGSVGEFITNTTTGTSISNLVAANATSVSLTPGDWDIEGTVNYSLGAGATCTFYTASVGLTSATLVGLGGSNMVTGVSWNNGLGSITLASPTVRVSITSTSTVYCVADAAFTGGTCTVNGSIRARRVR